MQLFPKKLTHVLIPIFLVFFLISCSSNPDTTKENHFKKGMVYLKQDKPKAAIIEFRSAIQIDPKFADARYQLGLLYLENGSIRKAVKQLERAASLDPDNIDARVKTAEFKMLAKDKNTARQMAEKLLADAPDNANVLALTANLELMDGNTDKAESLLTRAIAIDPNLDRLYSLQGRLYLSLKRYEVAEQSFKQAIDVAPDKLSNYQVLYTYYRSQRQNEQAEQTLKLMIDTFPEEYTPLLMYASLLKQNNKLDEAEETLKKAVTLFPENTRVRLILATFYRSLDKNDQAESAYLAAMEKSDKPLEVKGQLANFYFEQKQFDKARSIMQEILAENSKNGGGTLVKAKFLIKEGDNRQALTLLTEMAANYPDWADVFFTKALAHMNLGSTELALNSALEAINKDRGNSKYHTLLAQLHLQSKDYFAARQEAAIALKLKPVNFQAALLFAKSTLMAGEYEQAVTILEKMRVKVPENVEVLGNLGLAYLGAKDIDKAQATFQQLLDIQPGNTLALINIIRINSSQGKSKAELIELVKTQLEKAPESVGTLVLLGTMYAEEEQYDDARALFKKAQELAPQNPRPYMLSASTFSKEDRLDDAIAEYKSLLEQHPNDAQALMGLATLYELAGERSSAKELYEKIMTINPEFAPAANNLAWILAEEEQADLGEALRLAMIARELLPEEVHIIDTTGWVHYKRKSFTLARSDFSLAVEKQPDVPVFRYHLALALYGEGKKKEAIFELQKTLENKQDFKERQEAEALLQQWQQGA